MMKTAIPIDASATPRVAQLQSIFEERHRFSRNLIRRALACFGPQWASELEDTLSSLFPDATSLAAAAKGYAGFAFDSMRRQKAFEAAREYPSKSYAQAASEVYFNEQHMQQEYLPGLLLSHFLWPHHYRQLRFFDSACIDAMRNGGAREFAEIGAGTAVYSRRILTALPAVTGVGYDISPASCAFAERQVSAIGAQSRYRVCRQDVLSQPIAAVPWLVCVEVLEHLEDPLLFLRALRSALAPGGRAFITAALNAAHSDHIYLYCSGEEVLQHLQSAGFVLEQAFLGAAYAPPGPGVPVPLAAAFVVC
jgi:SAM-dependent methyltransferase